MIPVICTFASQKVWKGAYRSQTFTSHSGSERNYIHNQETE